MTVIVTDAARPRVYSILRSRHVDYAVRLADRDGHLGFAVEPARRDDAIVSWASGCVAVAPTALAVLGSVTVDADETATLVYRGGLAA